MTAAADTVQEMPAPAQLAWRVFTARTSSELLAELRLALLANSPEIVSRTTVFPPASWEPPGQCVQAACVVAWLEWKGRGLETTNQVQSAFAVACMDFDREVGQPCHSRWFTAWIDSTPRLVAFAILAADIADELAERGYPI